MARYLDPAPLIASPAGVDSGILTGRWLAVARWSWLAVATLAVGLTLAGAPVELEHLTRVCAAAPCADPHLTPTMAAELSAAGLSPMALGGYLLAVELFAVAAFVIVAVVIMRARPRQPTALLAALLLVSFGPSIGPMSSLTAVAPLVQLVGFVAGLSLFAFAYTFPQGRFVPRWTAWFALPILAWQVPDAFFRSSPISTYSWPEPVTTAVWLTVVLSIGFVQLYRYRRVSDAAERQQTRWVVAGMTLTVLCFAGVLLLVAVLGREPDSALGFALGGTAYYLALVPLPLSIGVAVLRDRLWGIEAAISRGAVYLGLTAAVVATYAGIVVGIGQLLPVDDAVLSLVATGVVAVGFQPMRLRLQRLVSRLVYGERDEPYAVLARLGRRLDETLEPEAVLPTVVSTLASAMRLPYVAIAVRQGAGLRVEATVGEEGREPLRLPLAHRGEEVGELVVGHRAGERAFSRRELALLRDVARQAGAAAHSVRLTSELRRSRERLILAREEERRRLRRDLHDGLGPALASVTLMADAARNLLASDASRTDALLIELKEEARSATAEIRRVVYELRPAALDELGLVGAIQEQAAQYGNAGVTVEVLADELAELPAAVEVAAYRIVAEGLTNVMRHSRATRCRVSIRCGRMLELEVEDDGRGIEARPGVGIASMRERAEELGGSFAVTSDHRGTRVSAVLPVAEAG